MAVSRSQILSRGLRCRCPNCGGPLIFGPKMRLLDHCPEPGCGMRWQGRNGFFLGAMVWNYAVTVFVGLALVVFAAMHQWLSTTAAVVLALAIALIVPWILYKLSWGWWLASYYFVLPHELPGNSMPHSETVSPDEGT